jgi:hypothetical protein
MKKQKEVALAFFMHQLREIPNFFSYSIYSISLLPICYLSNAEKRIDHSV